MNKTPLIKIAMADDHKMVCRAITSLIASFGNYEIIFTESSGMNTIKKLNQGLTPDILILDYDMPGMDGQETTLWVHSNFPQIRILILTAYDSEILLIKMLKAGAQGFLRKGAEDHELKFAIESLIRTGFYYNYKVTGKIVSKVINNEQIPELNQISLSEQEVQFIRLACTELTYRDICEKMGLPPRGADYMRNELFNKLGISSRVGLAIFAIKHGLIPYTEL